MRRIGVTPRVIDFIREVPSVNDWLTTITERFQVYSGAVDPTVAEVPDKQWILYRNTSTGEIKFWTRYGTTLFSVGGVGYPTGVGGTVTQLTNKSTAVTLDKLCGTITMNGAALANATTVTFTMNNSFITDADFVLLQHTSGGTLGAYTFAATPATGSVAISVRNVHTAPLSEAIVIRFAIIKAVTA